VDVLCVILEMLLILQLYLTNLALELISFSDIGQILPFEVFCQVSRTGKLVGTLFE
jgi:hypothetical protein